MSVSPCEERLNLAQHIAIFNLIRSKINSPQVRIRWGWGGRGVSVYRVVVVTYFIGSRPSYICGPHRGLLLIQEPQADVVEWRNSMEKEQSKWKDSKTDQMSYCQPASNRPNKWRVIGLGRVGGCMVPFNYRVETHWTHSRSIWLGPASDCLLPAWSSWVENIRNGTGTDWLVGWWMVECTSMVVGLVGGGL